MSPSPRRSKRESQGRPAGRGRVVSPTLAPGALELVQALVNTYDFASRVDELTTTGNLSAWLSRNGLLPAGAELSDTDLSRIRAVRAGLRALVAAHSGSRVNEADVAALDQATIGARAQVRFERDGTSRLELGSSHFEDALGTLLGIVLEAERS
ncbi:MAG: ABATE domain-containing protein, partial [Acidobacteriota bacterium]